MLTKPVRLEIYRTAIPMRSFQHAAAIRELAEAVVVRMEFSDGGVGWGETLPRPYVTGETTDSVVADISQVFWPAVAGRDIDRLDILRHPQVTAQRRCMNAAACAMDLASLRRLLDARDPSRWVLSGVANGPQRLRGRIGAVVSGVLGSSDPRRTARRLRLMRLYGLRDFKLKLGFGDEADAENLRVLHGQIGKAVSAGKRTLRVDVNGGWDLPTTPQRVAALRQYGVCAVEQPVLCTAGVLAELARRCELPLMADESLITAEDAQALLAEPRRVWWNIRLSKNGGLVPALALARLAAEHGVPTVVGCMVGETSILSAAQRLLLQLAAAPRFVEGNYGRFLLGDDLTRRSLRFGYGGRLRPLKGPGLGVQIDPAKLKRHGVLVASLTG